MQEAASPIHTGLDPPAVQNNQSLFDDAINNIQLLSAERCAERCTKPQSKVESAHSHAISCV